jgi:hypothetical protein
MTNNTLLDVANKHFQINTETSRNLQFNENELFDGEGDSLQLASSSFENKYKVSSAFNKRSWMIACGYCRLSPTDDIKSWIEKELRKYAKQIGITDYDISDVFFSEEEVNAMPLELTAGIRNVTFKCYGACLIEAKTIFINVKKHTSFERLKHTIVHELVHYRFRYLKHGRKFEKRISLILGGKRYRTKSLYIKNTPFITGAKNQFQACSSQRTISPNKNKSSSVESIRENSAKQS